MWQSNNAKRLQERSKKRQAAERQLSRQANLETQRCALVDEADKIRQHIKNTAMSGHTPVGGGSAFSLTMCRPW